MPNIGSGCGKNQDISPVSQDISPVPPLWTEGELGETEESQVTIQSQTFESRVCSAGCTDYELLIVHVHVFLRFSFVGLVLFQKSELVLAAGNLTGVVFLDNL